MTLSLRSNVALRRIVVVLVLFVWIDDGDSVDDPDISTSDRAITLAVSIHEDATNAIQVMETTHAFAEPPTLLTHAFSLASSSDGSSLKHAVDVHSTPSLDGLYTPTGVDSIGTWISMTDLSQTIAPTAVLLTNQYSTITQNNKLLKTTTLIMARISATASPVLPPPAMMSTLGFELTTEFGATVTQSQTNSQDSIENDSSGPHQTRAFSTQMMTSSVAQTISPSLASDEFPRQISSQPLSSHIPRITNHDSNLTTDRLDGSSDFNESVSIEWTTAAPINDTTAGIDTHQDSYSKSNNILIVSLSIVIGLFGLSALILRIWNRWKKRGIALEEKRRERTKEVHQKNTKRPSITKPVTIRMPSIINIKTTGNQSIRRPTTRKEKKSKTPTCIDKHPANENTTPKRNRTLEALIEIGALPREAACAIKDTTHPPRFTTIEREIISNVCVRKWANAFDNPALDFDSQEEINLKAHCLPVSREFRVDGKENGGVRQIFCATERLSDDKDSSAPSCTELTLETSETESASDLKGNRRGKRRKNVKFDRSMSNDSGFVDNTRLHDIRLPYVNPETIEEELTSMMTADDTNLDYSDDSQPDRLNLLQTSSTRDRASRRGSKRRRSPNHQIVRQGEYSDADQSSSETGGNETPSDDQNLKTLLTSSVSDSLMYENELTYPTVGLHRHYYYSSYNRRAKPRDHWQRYQKARDVSTQTAYAPAALSVMRWVYEDDVLVLRPRSEFELDFLGPIYLAECLPDYDNDVCLEFETENTDL